MATPQTTSPLQQMACNNRKERETRDMSAVRALRLGLARTAAHLWDLPIDIRRSESSIIGLEDVVGHLSETALVILLDGADGARGAVALDRSLVASMVEVQTIGIVSKMDPTDRTPTPTDAALIAPWLDGALTRVEAALQPEEGATVAPEQGWILGYRFGAMVEDVRSLALALEGPDFHSVRLEIDVALGTRHGAMTLLAPMPSVISAPKAPTGAKGAKPGGDAFLDVKSEISVIAGRTTLTLAQAGALAVGDVLNIDQLTLNTAEMRAVDGSVVGTGKLGRIDDNWALRLPGENGEQTETTAMEYAEEAETLPKTMGQMLDMVTEPTRERSGQSAGARPALANQAVEQEPLPDLPPLDFDQGGTDLVPFNNDVTGNASFE